MKRLFLVLMAVMAFFIAGCSSAPEKPSVSFEVMDEEALSNDRQKAVVMVSEKVSNQQLEEIAKYYVAKESEDKYISDCYVSFTDTDEDGIPYTLGQVKWNSKEEKFTENNLRADSKDWSTRPTKEEYELYDDLLDYLRESDLDEDAATAAFAAERNTSVEAVNAAFEKVTLWIMG